MESKDMAKVHQSSQRRRGDNVTQLSEDAGANTDLTSFSNVDKNPVTTLSVDRRSIQTQERAFSQSWAGDRQTAKQTQPTSIGRGFLFNRDGQSATVGQPSAFSQSYSDTSQGCFDQTGTRPKVRDGSHTVLGSQAHTASVQTQERRYQSEKYEDPRREVIKEPTMPDHEEDFHICLGVRTAACQSRAISIACDVVMFMKWQYILHSSTMLYGINKFLTKQNKGHLTPDSILWIPESFLLTELTQLITDVVGHFGSSLAVECVCGQKGEASGIVEKINSLPLVSPTHILYSFATNNSRVYLVYHERKETYIFDSVEKVCPNLMVQVTLPHVWAVMSETNRLQERLGLTGVSITLDNDVHADQIICQISGPLSQVKRAEKKLKMCKESLHCRGVNISEYLCRACKKLHLLDIIQEEIDRQISRECLIHMSESDGFIYLYAFNDKDFDVGVNLVKVSLCEIHVPRCVKSTGSSSVEKIKKEMIDNGIDHVTIFEENESLVIVGLTESAKRAEELIVNMSTSGRDNTQTHYSERLLVPKNELLDIVGLLAEDLAENNRVKLMRTEAAEGHVFEFSGEMGKVVKSVNEFDDTWKQLSMTKLLMDKDFVTSSRGADILAKTQSRYQVKLIKEKVDKYPPKSTNRGVRRPIATLDVQGDRSIWSFPTGRNLILDLLDIENCPEPDVLIVVVESKTGSTSYTQPTPNKHKQIKLEVHIPKWMGGDQLELKKFQQYFKRVLSKVDTDGYHSVGLSLQPTGQWPFIEFLEMMLVPVLKRVQAFGDKQGLNFFILCATSLNKLKNTEAFIRKDIDPDFDENSIQTVIVKGELNQFEADVLVNTTSPILDLNYGNVSAAILKSAGSGIQKECNKRYPNGVQGSSLAITGGHNLQCDYVFHGALTSYKTTNEVECLTELRDFLKNCLEMAGEFHTSSIAFPVIGSGKLRYPVELVASEMFTSVERFRQEKEDSSLRFVYFVVYTKDKETFEVFKKVQKDMVKYKPQPTNVAPNLSIETKEGSGMQTIEITIIGKDSDTKKAIAALQKREQLYHENQSKDGTSAGKVLQYISDISSHQYSAIMKLFPAEMEEIQDGGVEVKWMENRLNLSGDMRPVTKAVQQMKEMVKELNNMYHIQGSVAGTEIDMVESKLRSLRRKNDGILIIHDKIMSVIHLYGNDREDVKTAAKLLGFKAGLKDKNESKSKENDEDTRTGTKGPTVQHSFSFNSMSRNLKLFSLGNLLVRVYVGDLLESPAQCIVNAANCDLNHAGGVAKMIVLKGGADVQKQCYEISQNDSLKTGSVVYTSAGALSDRYKYILHTVGPNWFDYKPITEKSLSHCMEDLLAAMLNTFIKAEELKLTSIALPAISSAIFCVPREICALKYAHALLEFEKRAPVSVKEIYFVDQDVETISVIQDAFKIIFVENKTYSVNVKVYFDKQQKQRSESIEKRQTRNEDKDTETRDEENKGSGGIVLWQPFYTNENEQMSCIFTTHHELRIFTGDILELNGINAIVCSEDKSWSAAGMVARRLMECGGPEYKQEKMNARLHNTLDDGDVVVTQGGQNKYAWVIHALIPTKKSPEALKDLAEKIFHTCHIRGYRNTVMSLLGSGSGRSNPKVCSEMLLSAYHDFCVQRPGYQFILYLVNIDKDKTKILQSVFKEYIDKEREAQMAIKQSNFPSAGSMDFSESKNQSKVSQEAGMLDADFTKKHETRSEREIQKMLVPSGSLELSGRRQEKSFMAETGQTSLNSELRRQKNVTGVGSMSRSLSLTERGRQDLTNENKGPMSLDSSGSRQRDRASSTNQDHLSANEEKQTRDSTKGEDSADTDKNDKDENCVICMDTLDVPKTLKCGHMFCTECIEGYFKVKQACPTCFTVCGVITGDQPDGEVEIQLLRTSMAGYENCGSIGVSYSFKCGNQGPNHPRPGAWYKGINRTAYLPNTDEGRMICAMLKLAFERRLVFTIGTSRTTGQEGVITWNDIHHKTDHRPNEQFGYPDDTYLTRVKEELAAKGVTEEDIDEQFLNELKDSSSYRKSFSVKT